MDHAAVHLESTGPDVPSANQPTTTKQTSRLRSTLSMTMAFTTPSHHESDVSGKEERRSCSCAGRLPETSPLLSTRETRERRTSMPSRPVRRRGELRLRSLDGWLRTGCSPGLIPSADHPHQTRCPVSTPSLAPLCRAHRFHGDLTPTVPAGGERDLASPRHELEPSCSGHGEDMMNRGGGQGRPPRAHGMGTQPGRG
jgi:hypothetical protein